LTIFEGVEFTGDLTQLVVEQLSTGKYRGREDGAPSDWLDRAWHALPAVERSRLSAAFNQALNHSNPNVRAEAVRLLDGNPRMADPQRLLDVVEHRWNLFKGLRGRGDSPTIDRGRDLAQLTEARATGSSGARFRQKMAPDPVYGIHVLAALAESDSTWAVDHIHELVAPALDPNGSRLRRLGVPFVVSAFLLSPLAFWPSYLLGRHTSPTPYWIRFFTEDGWLIGAPWLLWVLLAFDGIVALVHHILIPLAWPAWTKFCTVFAGGLVVSWGVSHMLRRVPAIRWFL